MSIKSKFLALVMALVLVTGMGATAQAALTAVSPALGPDGFPLWYQDANGLKLQPCFDPVNCGLLSEVGRLCAAGDFNAAQPVSFPNNYPSELFYWSATSILDVGPLAAGRAVLVMAMEGTFANGCPVAGEQMTFTRVQVGPIQNLVPLTPYTITTPLGNMTLTSDAGGTIPRSRHEFGCVPVPPISTCDFSIALANVPGIPPVDGNPFISVGPFLSQLVPAPPIGFIGDGGILGGTMQAGPNGALFTIAGPLVNPNGTATISTDQFAVVGQLFETLGVARFIAKGDFDGDGADDLAAIDVNGVAWTSTGLAAWSSLAPVVGTQYVKIVTGDFNNARPGEELAGLTDTGRVFVYNDMLTPTELNRPIGVVVKDIVVGDFNIGRLGDELVGLSTLNKVLVAADMVTFVQSATGTIDKIVALNFDGLPMDIAGLSTAGKIWISTDLGATQLGWTNIPGTLAQMMSGDFNGDGLGDLGGLSAAGKIWLNTILDTNPLNWVQVPGTLGKIVPGDLNAARVGDELVGINAVTRKMWVQMTPLPVPSAWIPLAGTGDQILPIDFDTVRAGDELAVLNALTGKVWTSPDGIVWTVRNP